MADQELFGRPTLLTPPADNDFVWTRDMSDLTDGLNGTDKKQEVSVFRTHGDQQFITLDNAGTLGPDTGEVHLNLTVASFFRVRNNVGTALLSVSNAGSVVVNDSLSITTGNININAGDLIVQAGTVTANGAGTNTFGGTVEISAIAPTINMNGALGNISCLNSFFVTVSSGNINFNANNGGLGIINLNPGEYVSLQNSPINDIDGIERLSGAADPLPADIANTYFQIWENTTATMQTSGGAVNETSLWTNISGSMYRSKPLNYEAAVSWFPTVVEVGGPGTYLTGGSVAVYDIDGNKAFLNIELTDINSNVAPSGGTFRISNLPFPYVRDSGMLIWFFNGGDQDFNSISARVVNNGGNAEIEFIFQDPTATPDANLNKVMTEITMTNGNISLCGYMYI